MAKIDSDLLEGEAHLFCGVAKSDGKVSISEFSQIPYYARKSQRFYDMMELNEASADAIGPRIQEILSDKIYRGWSAEDHLEEALSHIKKALKRGVWQAKVVFVKNETGFVESAKIDGLYIKESIFIEKMEKALKNLGGD